jgi:hypothetical protein
MVKCRIGFGRHTTAEGIVGPGRLGSIPVPTCCSLAVENLASRSLRLRLGVLLSMLRRCADKLLAIAINEVMSVRGNGDCSTKLLRREACRVRLVRTGNFRHNESLPCVGVCDKRRKVSEEGEGE